MTNLDRINGILREAEQRIYAELGIVLNVDVYVKKPILIEEKNDERAKKVIDLVKELSGVDITNKSRLAEVVKYRRMAMWYLRDKMQMTYKDIGKILKSSIELPTVFLLNINVSKLLGNLFIFCINLLLIFK